MNHVCSFVAFETNLSANNEELFFFLPFVDVACNHFKMVIARLFAKSTDVAAGAEIINDIKLKLWVQITWHIFASLESHSSGSDPKSQVILFAFISIFPLLFVFSLLNFSVFV